MAPPMSGVHAGDPRAVAEGEAHAKSFMLLRATFEQQGEVGHVGLGVSRNGEPFRNVAISVSGSASLPRSVCTEQGITTILLPVVGEYTIGPAAFVFEEPGTYDLSWGIELQGADQRGLKFEQTLEVVAPRDADLRFLEGVGDPDLLRELRGADFFDRQTPVLRERLLGPSGGEHRALIMVRDLLTAASEDDPGDAVRACGSLEAVPRWANALFSLGEEYPQSSYSPYASYFAGCCYLVCLQQANKDKEPSGEGISSEANSNLYYAKAQKALAFAADKGDTYLKPRAHLMLVHLHALAAEWAEAEQGLAEAAKLGGEQGTIADRVTKWRAMLAKAKEKYAAKHGGD